MAAVAEVKDGKLVYDYTDSSKKELPTGSKLGYDQFLQLLCAEMQYQDPLEPTSNTEYVAQLATFSQLEAVLGLQTTQESTMANDLVGKTVIMKVTNETTGATTYVDGKVDYTMYQDGEIYLSVNDKLYPLKDLDTVADPAYYEAMGVAKSITNMLAQLPDSYNITPEYDSLIQQIQELYDGMSDYEKQFVSADDVTKLKEYQDKLAEAKAKAKTFVENMSVKLEEQFKNLPEDAGSVALDNEEQVNAIKEIADIFVGFTQYQYGVMDEGLRNKITALFGGFTQNQLDEMESGLKDTVTAVRDKIDLFKGLTDDKTGKKDDTGTPKE